MNFIGVLDALQDIFAVICGVLFLRVVGDYRERSRTVTVITCILSFIISLSVSRLFHDIYYEKFGAGADYDMFILGVEAIQAFSEMLIWIAGPLIILRVTQKFKRALLLFSLVSVSEFPNGLLIIIFNGTRTNEPVMEYVKQSITVLCYVVISILLIEYKRRNKLAVIKNVLDNAPNWLYFLIFMICVFAHFVGGLEVVPVRNVVVVVTTVGVVLAIVYLMRNVTMLTMKQSEILTRLDEQQSGYEKMLHSDEQLREFRHDYKNHMMVVTALLNAGKNDEAADYLEKVKIKSGIIGRQFSTGNFVVDAILNNKNSLAEEFEIYIGFSGVVPESGIDNADLCTVVSNLLDNAIEGTKHFNGNRYINITSSVRNGYVALSFANPVDQKVEIKGNRIKTTKQDSKNHGIGLKNVQNTAEKYGGTMLLDCSDTEFTADINMKLEH